MITHPDFLTRLYLSTDDLYARFGLRPTREATLAKLAEEARELTDAVVYDAPYEAIAEEAVDVLVCVLGVCIAAGITLHDVTRAVERVIEKNNAKTWDTHTVLDKLIVRRSKLQGAE